MILGIASFCKSWYPIGASFLYSLKGKGILLIKDAKFKANLYRCQLALVDMRLRDNSNSSDITGLDLIPELRPTKAIVLSGYGDQATSRKSILEKGAVSFVGKGEGPEILKLELEKEAHKICGVFRRFQIEPSEMVNHIVDVLFNNVPLGYHDQIIDVFARLFPDAKHLRLEKLGSRKSPTDFSTVPRPKSVILKVYEDNKQPVIVKLARAHKMSIELDRFESHIKGYLKGHFHPLMSNPVILWDLGGAIYTSLGSADSHTFSKYYNEASFADIEYSLTHFFCETWSPLYAEPKTCENVSLFEEYCKVWGKEWYARVCKFASPDPKAIMGIELPGGMAPIDPLAWLRENVGNNIAENKSMIANTALTVTHGDLHGDNLLIDDRRNAWVIDFERSGEGHILQDFIELESDIISRLISSSEKLPSFYSLCVLVAQSIEIKELEDIDQFTEPNAKKSIQTISLLRRLAREISGITDAKQYLLGLLFNTLFRATITGKSAQQLSQQRALMLASIICHRLKSLGRALATGRVAEALSKKREQYARNRTKALILLSGRCIRTHL